MSIPSTLPTIKEIQPQKKDYFVPACDLLNGKSISICMPSIQDSPTPQSVYKRAILKNLKKMDQPSKYPLKKRNIGPATVVPLNQTRELNQPSKESCSCCTIT